jgi:CNT family concentrative nucleoside transporter
MGALQSFFGLIVFLAASWAISENRRAVRLKPILLGLLLQTAMALLMLKMPFFKDIFMLLNDVVSYVEGASRAGTSFVFGYLGGGALPFDEKTPGGSFIFALQALPIVLIVSALSSLLFYWKILPVVVRGFSWMLQKSMGVSGAVGLSAAANVFLGMVESPLFIKPYFKDLTRSELFIVMTGGMANVAGTVMVLYATALRNAVPDAMGHILAASIISTPAAIIVSLLMVPETEVSRAGGQAPPSEARGAMDAVARGTQEGVELLINIIAMLIVLVGLVYLANRLMGILPDIAGAPMTMQRALGWCMAPVVWLIGIPWAEAGAAGALMGTKTVLNEFIAYLNMAELPSGTLSPRSALIMTYALCGFANFGSLGIMIGGLGAMCPERKSEVTAMGMKTIVSGTLSTCLTGCMVGILTP